MPNDFLYALSQITSRKYIVKISLVFDKDFQFNTVALFDTGADLNCIKSSIVPKRFQETTKERLSSANNSKMHIEGKTEASILNNDFLLKTSFLIVSDISYSVIIGTPFINLITPYTVTHNSIFYKDDKVFISFPFLEKPKTRQLNFVKAHSIYKNQINFLIKSKENDLFDLKQNVHFQKIEQQLEVDLIKVKISDFKTLVIKEVCSDLPNAFWKRKQHIVDLPYESGFDERNIPTKARPIQMNVELEQYCRKEIQDLESKGLISKSRSPWSCAAFYVNKASKQERGTPRLVINYKPLNTALKWIRYPIPNKKDLLQKLHSAFVFSKFDMKSGFWQIQIEQKHHYKTAFTVPFGQYEWNVMPFSLKNAPSEF